MKFGLLGKTLSYSYSKDIHMRYFELNQMDANYELYEIESHQLEDFILFSKENLHGFNVTIPYKTSIIPYLDYVDPLCIELNSVNTVVNENGKLLGYNTDYPGFSLMMERNKINFTNQEVVVLGTGATSMMVGIYAKNHHARKISFVSRNPKENQISYDSYITGDILINTTPVGMNEKKGELPIPLAKMRSFHTFIDLLYNPFHTRFLIEANFMKKKAQNGLYMLVAQAIYAQCIWHSMEFDISLVNQIYAELILKKTNIVLIGMPNSGKSTVGYFLSKYVNMEQMDTDRLIQDTTQSTISDLFSQGEEYFREIETKIIKEVSQQQGKIISCGGGVIKKKENMYALWEHGIVFFLNRHLEQVASNVVSANRPLVQTQEDLLLLFKKRITYYRKYSMFEIKNYGVKKTVRIIRSILGGL